MASRTAGARVERMIQLYVRAWRRFLRCEGRKYQAEVMKRGLRIAVCAVAFTQGLAAHDPSSVPITWNREISRIVYEHCASCHRPGGTAFSLMTYQEAQPRASAIKDAVLSRRMPPFGAVKGFGDFRNDSSLAQEQIALVADWVEGGASRGNNPKALPPVPAFEATAPVDNPKGGVVVRGDGELMKPLTVDGVLPRRVPRGTSMQIVAARPDGGVVPMVWLYQYDDRYRHPFLFRKPIALPAGSVIRGLPPGAEIELIPVRR